MSNLYIITVAFFGTLSASNVIDLSKSKKEFEEKVGHDIALVEFFAPWCGHCKKLAPEYEKAAENLANTDPGIKLVKVDCTSDIGKGICKKYEVNGYPTLKMFKNGDVSDYNGARDAMGIVRHMKKYAGPPSVLVTDTEELEKKVNATEDNIIVGFFSSENDELNKFIKNADKLRDNFQFIHAVGSVVWKDLYSDIAADSVLLFRPKYMANTFEEPRILLSGDDLEQAIKDNEQGHCGHVTVLNRDRFVAHSLKTKKFHLIAFYDLDHKKDPSKFKYIRNRLTRVAKTEMDIGFSVAGKTDFQEDMDKYGTTDGSKVTVVATDKSEKPYIMVDDFSQASVQKFIQELKAGKIEPFIKSEPIPDNNSDYVKVVVGKTFEKIVNDASKDVLIEFYAPWCGHCKKLEPKYNDAAKKLRKMKGYGNVIMAKMDATVNDVPSTYQVSGFPTIYWAPAGGKSNPTKYSGGRETDDFIEYIKREHKPKKTEL